MKTKFQNCCSVQRLLPIVLFVFGLNLNAPAGSVFQSHLSTPAGSGGAQLSLGQFYFRVEADQVDFVALIFPLGPLTGSLSPVLSVPDNSINFSLGAGASTWFHGSHTIADHNPFLPTEPWLPAGYDENGNPLYLDTMNIRMADVYTGHFILPPGFEADLLAGLGSIEFNSSVTGTITVAAVPEPTTLSLALLAGFGWFTRSLLGKSKAPRDAAGSLHVHAVTRRIATLLTTPPAP